MVIHFSLKSHNQVLKNSLNRVEKNTSDHSGALAPLNDNSFASGASVQTCGCGFELPGEVFFSLTETRTVCNHCFLLFQINVIEAKKKTDILMAVSAR